MKPLSHRRIPEIPERPRVQLVSGKISRSYTAGRQHFSRAYQNKAITLTISTAEPLPGTVTVRLSVERLQSDGMRYIAAYFERIDDQTLVCRFTPNVPGLHTYRAEYSFDGGETWLQDTVPDAWVLVDPPQVDGLRLYTMVPSVSGSIADWKANLKRVADTGFTAIHLLPVTTQDTSESPYSAKDLFSVDPAYLAQGSGLDGLAQLEDYVEAAKSLNIQLCFDLVLNHVGVNSLIARRAPDWIVPDQSRPDGLARAGYWSNAGWLNWDDLVLINYEHPSEMVRAEIWSYMTDYALFWAKYANDTGGIVRLDNLHGSDPNFMKALSRTLNTEYPEVAVLAEYFTDEQTIINTVPEWNLNLLLATPWEHKYVPELREHLKYLLRVSGQIRFFSPVSSHDSGTPAQEFGSPYSTLPRYIAAALLGTGATGIVQGVEYGEKVKINFIGKRPSAVYPAAAIFGEFIGKVNSILASYPAFRCGPNCTFVDDGHNAVIAAFRADLDDIDYGYLVICNFDISGPQFIAIDLTKHLPPQNQYKYIELLTGNEASLAAATFEVTLAPCAAQVLRFTK